MRRVGREMGYVGTVGSWTLNREKIDYLGSWVRDGRPGLKGWMIMIVPPSNRRGDDQKQMV